MLAGDGFEHDFGSGDLRVNQLLDLAGSVLVRVVGVAVLVSVAHIGHDDNGGSDSASAGADSTAGFLCDLGPGVGAGLGGAAATTSGRAAGASALGGDEGSSCCDSENLQKVVDMVNYG